VDLRFIVNEDPFVLGDPPRIEALLDLLEYDLASPSPYFDPQWYLDQFEVEAPTGALLRHFLSVGLADGRKPNPFLDPVWYAEHVAEAPRDPYRALRHFIVLGDIQAFPAGPNFDGLLYRRRYTDIADAGVPPLRHYLMHGRKEGRQIPNDRAPPPPPADTAAPPAAPAGELAQQLPIDADAALASYTALAEAWEALQQKRKDALQVTAPALLVSNDPAMDMAGIELPAAAAPRLSILVPAFNEPDYTVACLLAISLNPPLVPFEVVLADDCSTDPDMALLADVANLVYLRAAENQGFLRNCNAAFAHCRGEYVLLLNNDAQPLPGALDRLVAALDADPTVAAVGPKLIYPSGRLQEAGCFLRPNGESTMVGLFGAADEAGYCMDRDVAYCSGAALMIRRALVGDTLFDEAFLPAYCEDADLCLRFLAAGHRVRYVHAAVVVHALSVTFNQQSVPRKLRRIQRNQQTLTERWDALLARLDRVRPIAFYLPQFHPTQENNLWWGAGFTEWTNVAKARPSYAGHYQPHLPADLGYYDLRLGETLAAQAALAARYGIEGFCVYFYNFGSRRVLSAPLRTLRASPEIPFRFCLCWANENWTRHWDGGEREILLEQKYDAATLETIIADAVEHAADPRYIRVNGKPLLLVYRPLLLPDAPAFAADARAAFTRAGFAGVHLVYVESMEAVDLGVAPADLGFDGCVEFPPHGRAVASETAADILKPDWAGHRYDYPDTVLSFLGRDSVAYTRYPAVFPNWDNTPRQPLTGTSFDRCTPEAFRFYVEQKIEEIRGFHFGDERLLFINAWNEWAEGTHLEPDTGYGHRWLEALRDALLAKRAG
jgi:GT2 family glycosyltransferase